MLIQIKAPWRSMKEQPEFDRYITFMGCDPLEDNPELLQRTTYVISRRDWNDEKGGLGSVYLKQDRNDTYNAVPFMWCYTDELVLSEFLRMVKE